MTVAPSSSLRSVAVGHLGRGFVFFACLLAPSTELSAAEARGPLRVSDRNPRYFADPSGKIVYLTGSHVWNNLVDMGTTDPPPPFDFDAYLDWLEKRGHNFIRLWTWELVSWDTGANSPAHRKERKVHTVRPHPWLRAGPGEALDGKPKLDLKRFDPEYFDRLRSRVSAAGKRGIYVSVMLFEGWGLQRIEEGWKGHPFHPENNTNGIDGDPNGDGRGLEVHELVDPAVTAIQEAYVRKVIETVGDLDNVLYEISNENHPESTRWQYHMIDFIHATERTKPKQHPVGMTFQYQGGKNSALSESPAEWVSPNAEGGYRDDPPPADGKKVVLSDTDHLWGIGGSADWAWKTFLRGHQPIFMDPYDGQVLGEPARPEFDGLRKALGATRTLAEKIDLAGMLPKPELASTRYCLAKTGSEYLVYRPRKGRGEAPEGKDPVGARLEPGAYTYAWLDPETAEVKASGRIEAGEGEARLEAPSAGALVLHIKR